MSSTPQFTIGQLASARAKAWHQTGEALLTLDAAREWVASTGLLLFAPRAQHIQAPAPSLVEATLGAANDAPSSAQTDTARSLVARLVSEGNALPLNLLGGPGDLPDFVVSAQVFSFVFTLRGDKLWKQPPAATSGLSPLALRVHEVLSERGALTAPELVSELGRELTENAVARALHELWTLLRVIPLLQQGEGATMWELTSRRFTKAIKAGVNAGQPTALSGLISLYLAQALLASEDEVAAFLSPLAPRSRIREVLHGMTAARQLEPVVLEGKGLLYIPGTLPEFPAAEEPAVAEQTAEPAAAEAAGGEGRIKRFAGSKDKPVRGDFKGKPVRSFAARPARPSERGARPGASSERGPRPERSDRERRPFQREGRAAAAPRSSFTQPWKEENRPRRDAEAGAGQGPAGAAPPKRTYDRPRPTGSFSKPRDAGDRPARGGREGTFGDRPARKTFPSKPPFRKERGEGFAAKPRFERSGERPSFPKRDRDDRGSAAARPRREFSGDRPSRPREGRPGGEGFSRPPFDRAGDRSGGAPPAKRPYVRRDGVGGERPSRPPFDRSRSAGGESRDARGGGERKPFRRADGAPADRGERRPFRRPEGGPAGSSERPRRSFGEGAGSGPSRSFGARPERGGARPGGAGRPTGGGRPAGGARPTAGRPAGGGSFAKRAGGKVPFDGKPAFGKRGDSGPRPPRRTSPGAGPRPRPEAEDKA